MGVRHARPSLRPRRAAVVAAIGAIAIFSGIQWADASQDGRSAAPASAAVDPTPYAEPAAADPAGQPVEPDYEHSIPEGPTPFAAAAAEPPLSGTGWKAGTARALLATGYTFKFRDQRAADWLGPYVRPIAAQMSQITGIRYTVDTTPVGTAYKRVPGDVIVHLYKRPCKAVGGSGISTQYQGVSDGSGAQGFSCAFNWYANWTVQSGEAWINTEHFTATGGPSTTMGAASVTNLVAHELGHTMGLRHANDSAREGDCAKGAAGEMPVMCRPHSGAYKDRAAGRFVQQFDLQGLRVLAANGGAKPPPQGPIVGVGGKCLDVRSAALADGTQIQLYRCNGSDAQKWILNGDGSINALGKCIDNSKGANAIRNKIQLYVCNGSAAQKWQLNAKGQLVNPATGKVLDVKGGSTADSTVVQLYTANSGKGQVWRVPTG